MAAQLAWLRSRLLLPEDSREGEEARQEAEALRRRLADREHARRLADWLERRPRLGRDVFVRGRAADGFEAPVREAICRANETLRKVRGAWVKDMNVMIEDGNITGYKVNLAVTFVLEDTAP